MNGRGPAYGMGDPPESGWTPFARPARANRQGRRGRRPRLAWPDAVILALLACAAIWCAWRMAALPEYHWQWSLLGDFLIRRDASGGARRRPGRSPASIWARVWSPFSCQDRRILSM